MEENNPIQEMDAKKIEETANGQTNIPKKANSLSLTSFIISLVGLLVAGLPCGIVAIITGIMGITKFKPETEKFKWMSVVGIIIGAIDVILTTLNIILTAVSLTA